MTAQPARRLALAAAATAALLAAAGLGALHTGAAQPAARPVLHAHAVYATIPSLAELTNQSSAVVLGRVVGPGVSHLVSPTAATAPFAPQPAADLPSNKPALGVPAATGPAAKAQLMARPGIPVTTFTIQITKVLRGAATANTLIHVNQLGGQIVAPTGQGGAGQVQTLEFDADPLMAPGQAQLLFLSRNGDSTFATVGGPQGRFNVVAGKLFPVDPSAATAAALSGKSVDAITSDALVAPE